MTIPATVPAGRYYVGAIVTVNGFNDDDYTYNNATSFYSTITVNPQTNNITVGQGAPNPQLFVDAYIQRRI